MPERNGPSPALPSRSTSAPTRWAPTGPPTNAGQRRNDLARARPPPRGPAWEGPVRALATVPARLASPGHPDLFTPTAIHEPRVLGAKGARGPHDRSSLNFLPHPYRPHPPRLH